MSDALTLNYAASGAKPLRGRGHWGSLSIKPHDWRTLADPPVALTGATSVILKTDASTASLCESTAVEFPTGADASGQYIAVPVPVPLDAATTLVSGVETLLGLRVYLDINDTSATAEAHNAGFVLKLRNQALGLRTAAAPSAITENYKRIINKVTGDTVANLSATATDWPAIWTTLDASYDASAAYRHVWVWDYSSVLDAGSKGIMPGDTLYITLAGISSAAAQWTSAKHLRGAFVAYKKNIGGTPIWLGS